MAKTINPSKLLPSAKSTAIVRVGKSKSTNIIAKTSPLSKGLLAKRENKDTIDANNKLVKVDKFLKSDLIVSKKKAEVKRKDKEKEDFAEAEKKLELPKFKGIKLPGISAPSLGFMDRVKRFIFFTALGWALPKILEFLPKLQGFANIIGGVYKFAEGLFGKLFDGFMSLVKFGGDLKDKTLGFIATAKAGVGGNYQKEFDKLEKQFNTFVNASIIAGVLAADIGGAAVDEYNKWRKKNVEPGKPKPGEKPKGKPKVTVGRGGEKAKGKPKVTTGKGGKPPGWWNRILKGPFAKLKGPLSRFAGAAVPGLGAAVGAADAAARFKTGDNIGGTLASVSAALDAATAATALTGIGLPVAGILGTISIGIDVLLLVRDIVKVFFPFIPMFSRGGRVVRKYQAGGTTRGGKPVGAPKRRAITPTKNRPIKVRPPKSKPGQDVGGEKKIKEFYSKKMEPGDPDYYKALPLSTILSNLGGGVQKLNERPYKALTTTAKILKEIPLVGGIMGAAVDVALGQKPDARVYRSLSDGIGSLVESLANQRVNVSMTSLMKDIKGFAEGGNVPASRELKGDYRSISSGDLIAKVLGPTIEQRVNEAIQSIQKELQKRQEKKEAEKKQPGPGPGPGDEEGGDGTGKSTISKIKFSSEINEASKISGMNASQIAAMMEIESTFNPRADSGYARGLMQIAPATYRELYAKYGKKYSLKDDIYDPKTNTVLGSLYMRDLYNGPANKNLETMVKMYNAGPAGNLQGKEPSNHWKKFQVAYERSKKGEILEKTSFSGGLSGDYLQNLNKVLPGITLSGQSYRASREGGREHAGRDYDLPTDGVFYSRLGGEVIFAGNAGGGYGNVVDIYNKDLNRTERIAEGTTILSGIKVGSIISPGQPVVQGTDQTGVIHYEIRKGKAGPSGSVEGTEDPDAFLSSNNYKDYLQKVKGSIAQKPAGRLTAQQAKDLENKIANLKPGDKTITVPGIGSISVEKGPRYSTKKVYKNASGKEITQQEFSDLMMKYKLPTGSSKTAKMQSGGLVSPVKPNRAIPNSFASYETPRGGMMIAIQPMIIEKQIPVSGGNGIIAFPVPIGVNNTMNNLSNLSQG